MRPIKSVLWLGIVLSWTQVAFAQEIEAKLIDEVIARINGGVIMRSAFESAQRDVLEGLKKQGLQGEQLERRFKEWRPRILNDLINAQLLAQRAKELGINVEPQVNQQLLRMMKENNCESLECLGQKMREAGFDMDEVKRVMTENFSKDAVLYREVYGRTYQTLTEREKRETYEQNRSVFTEPGEVTLSQIFIGFGQNPDQTLARVNEIAAQARSGAADFTALARRFSEKPLANDGGKQAAAIKIADLVPGVKTAVETAPVESVTDPIKLEDGYYIFRIDHRKETRPLAFEDEKVQDHLNRLLVSQYAEKQIETYLARLRDEAFIEIDSRYRFANAKVSSAPIKRVPYVEEREKKKRGK
jgi:parvulin-like peptidyl-prolyl isomerase